MQKIHGFTVKQICGGTSETKGVNLTCAGQSSQFDNLLTKKRPRHFLSYSSVCSDSRRQQLEWIMCIWNYTTFNCAHDHRQLPASREFIRYGTELFHTRPTL